MCAFVRCLYDRSRNGSCRVAWGEISGPNDGEGEGGPDPRPSGDQRYKWAELFEISGGRVSGKRNVLFLDNDAAAWAPAKASA